MWINSVTIVFIALLVMKLIVEEVLEKINNRHILKHREQIPEGFEQFIDPSTYQKSIDYTLAKSEFSSLCSIWILVFDSILIISGFLPSLWSAFSKFFGLGILGQATTLLGINIILSSLTIPFSWWRQFYLEESFGFNRSTQFIFWMDKIKGCFIALLFGLPILSVIIYLFREFPNSWWIWGWTVLMLFQVLMIVLYPLFILPLFNKLTPLPEGELKNRLIKLATASHFPINKIYTMDGSKRSAHSNAFFTGLGKFRHIVLHDTLIAQMTVEEIAAVLAHEIGHYKHQHVAVQLMIEGICTFLGFGVLYYLSSADWFLKSFGFDVAYTYSFVPLVLIFSMIIPGITFWIEPLFNYLSRKHEYAADRFAREALGEAESLISGLRKLHRENLSNLTPHPIFTAFHYAHPTLLEREFALKK
ncbi:MAG: M48 family metallopeptidase [Puniceicoccales bacterium]|jgi:STE24 endopeptidase|nr:M48 family metallopeptidase [Puniceicoccales bacterium]